MKRIIFLFACIVNNIAISQIVTEEMHLDMLMSASRRDYDQVNFDSLVTVTIAKINSYRKQNDLNALQVDSKLNAYSKTWSEKCLTGPIKHSDIAANGIKAENIHFATAFGAWMFGKALFHTIPDEVFMGWKNSPGHNKNMLTGNVTRIGLSISTYFDGNDYKLVSVMVVQ